MSIHGQYENSIQARLKKLLPAARIVLLGIFVLCLLFGRAIAEQNQAQGSGAEVQHSGSSWLAEPAEQDQPATSGQAQMQTGQIGDNHDPDTGSGIPEADFVFEVPVELNNIAEDVNRFCVGCYIYRGSGDNMEVLGTAETFKSLINRGYSGYVLVPVNYKPEVRVHNARRYCCNLYLIDPGDGQSKCFPSASESYWCRPDPERNFVRQIGGELGQ